MAFETAFILQPQRERGQDRVEVIRDGERTVIVVADGAGGIGDGDRAAEAVVREVKADHATITTAVGWEAELRQIDSRISAGEATAVVVDLRPDRVCGASVGDSVAWIVDDDRLIDLTAQQHRKPLLGSREASPVGFDLAALSGLLIVATDGFANCAQRDKLPALVNKTEFFSLPRRLVELVRLPSGDLWDDIGIVVCRRRPPQRTRQRYTI